MKRILLLLALLTPVIILAQTSGVGINTTAPTHTLDVNGTTRIRSMNTKTEMDPNEYLVIQDNNGVLSKITKVDFNRNRNSILILNGKASGSYNQSSTDRLYSGYLFDANYDCNFILPPAVEGATIYYFGWGGGSVATYTFTGSAAGNLSAPALTAAPDASNSLAPYRLYPDLGIEYHLVSGIPDTPSANWKLKLKQPRGSGTNGHFRFRYTKLEFICFQNNWYFVHSDSR